MEELSEEFLPTVVTITRQVAATMTAQAALLPPTTTIVFQGAAVALAVVAAVEAGDEKNEVPVAIRSRMLGPISTKILLHSGIFL